MTKAKTKIVRGVRKVLVKAFIAAMLIAVVSVALPFQKAHAETANIKDIVTINVAKPKHVNKVKKVVKTTKKHVVKAVVKEGDTLSSIASAHKTTPKRLYDANKQIADPDLINPGEKIRIPDPKEKLPNRELPQEVPEEAPVASSAPEQSYSEPAAAPSAPVVSASDGSVWDRLAACEAGGNWSTNTGNGYYGGLQFSASSWAGVGGHGLPSQASREEQIARAKILQARSGWGAWPACAKMLGLY